jgi:hypothetical protein
VTAAAILLPHLLPASGSGLSLRVGSTGPPSADAPSTRIAGPVLDESVGAGAGRPLHATVAGWVFLPWTGEYHFALSVRGDARLEIDGAVVTCGSSHEAAGPPPSIADVTEVRCAPANLLKGFRRIMIAYRRRAGDAHLLLRWAPPSLTGFRAIPAYYFLPDDAAPAERRQRTLILVGQRVGLLAVTLLVVLRLAGLSVRRAGTLGRTGGQDRPVSPVAG